MSISSTYGAQELFPITFDDEVPVEGLRAIYVTASGDLDYVDNAGNEDTIPVDKFMIIPIIGKWIFQESSTATIFGMR